MELSSRPLAIGNFTHITVCLPSHHTCHKLGRAKFSRFCAGTSLASNWFVIQSCQRAGHAHYSTKSTCWIYVLCTKQWVHFSPPTSTITNWFCKQPGVPKSTWRGLITNCYQHLLKSSNLLPLFAYKNLTGNSTLQTCTTEYISSRIKIMLRHAAPAKRMLYLLRCQTSEPTAQALRSSRPWDSRNSIGWGRTPQPSQLLHVGADTALTSSPPNSI